LPCCAFGAVHAITTLSLYLLIVYGGAMKVLRLGICLLVVFSGARGFASEPAADADPWSGVTGLLAQEHQHSRPSTPPMSLAELETAALANNPEIRVAMRRVAIAGTRVRSAGSLSDPEFMYRGWGTPLAKPWDLNQTHSTCSCSISHCPSGQAGTAHTTCFGGSGTGQSGIGGQKT
jgi:hypothetical protein